MSFMNDLRMSFESGVVYTDAPDQYQLDSEAMDDRLDFRYDEEPDPSLNSLQDTLAISSQLDEVVTLREQVLSTDPSMLPGVVQVANAQIVDVANRLDIKPPLPMKINPNTMELSMESMVQLDGWLTKALSSLVEAIGNSIEYVNTTITRSRTSANGINSRVKLCYKYLKKEDEDSSDTITVTPRWLAKVILENDISNSPVVQLDRISELISTLGRESMKVITLTSSALKESLSVQIESKDELDNLLRSKVDNSEMLAKLKSIQDKDELYIGNLRFRVTDESKLIPSGTLINSTPDANLVARSFNPVPRLTHSSIRSMLGSMSYSMEKHLGATEDTFKNIQKTLKDLKVKSNIKKNEEFDILAELNKFVKRSTSEFEATWKDLDKLNKSYFETADGIMGYIEESLMQK